MKNVMLAILLLCSSLASGANVFTEDPNVLTWWQFEGADFYGDSLGSADWITYTGVTADTDHEFEGAQCAAFSSGYLRLANSTLAANHPLKYGTTEKDLTICMWVEPTAAPSTNDFQLIGRDPTGATNHAGLTLKLFTYGGAYGVNAVFQYGASSFDYGIGLTLTQAQMTHRLHVAFTYNSSSNAWRFRVYDATTSQQETDTTGTTSGTLYLTDDVLSMGAAATSNAYYFPGYIDDVMIANRVFSPDDIDAVRMGTYGSTAPAQANTPSPADDATDQLRTVDLSWTAGTRASSHDVYFGTDPDNLTSEGNQAGTTFDPGTLEYGTVYSWRIDEVNDTTEETTTGVVWSFTVQNEPNKVYVSTTGNDSTGTGGIGSPYATVAKALTVADGGDTIYVRGGVYVGQVALNANGEAGEPITIKAYTGETPIFTTSVAVTGWTQCEATDVNLVRGAVTNENYASIYMVKTADNTIALYEGWMLLGISTHPNRTHKNWPVVSEMRDIPDEGDNFSGQSTTITDASFLIQADDYWNGASVRIRSNLANNFISEPLTISDFDGTSHKITFATLAFYGVTKTLAAAGEDFSSNDDYLIQNSPMAIDEAGEYCTVALAGGRYAIYFWPVDTDDLEANIRRNPSTDAYTNGGGCCFYCTNASYGDYLTLEDLTVKCSLGGFEVTDPARSDHLVLRNCSAVQVLGTGFYISYTSDALLQNCTAVGGNSNEFSFGNNTDLTLDHCTSGDCLGTAIFLNGCTRPIVTDCNIVDPTGTHGNGLTAYQSCQDVLLARNTILTTQCSITLQDSENLYVIGNLIYKPSGAGGIIDWGGCSGTRVYAYNTVQGCGSIPYGTTGSTGTSTGTLRVIGNILSSATFSAATTHTYNIYTDTPTITPLGTGESVATAANTYMNAAGNDFTLKAGSAAIAVGADPSSYLPTTTFPDVDFTKDMLGHTFGTDAGAYKYESSLKSPGAWW